MLARGLLLVAVLLALTAVAPAQEPGEILYEFPPSGVALPPAPGVGLRHTTQNVSSTAFADQIIDQGLIARGQLILPSITAGPGATVNP